MTKDRLIINEEQKEGNGGPSNPTNVFVYNATTIFDATVGGAIGFDFSSNPIIFINIGQTATFEVEGKIKTRNALDLIGSISVRLSGGVQVTTSSSFSDMRFILNGGIFKATYSTTRVGSLNYNRVVNFEIRGNDSGSTVIDRLFKTAGTGSGLSSGGILPGLTITFKESDANNEFFISSAICKIYSPTHP